MTANPSIFFSQFASRNDPVLLGWSTFREHVRQGARASAARAGRTLQPSGEPRLAPVARSPRATALTPDARSGIWRLLASNNREVARSLFLYESLSSARAHVLQLRQQTDEMTVMPITGPGAGQHGWYVTIDNVSVMSCGRWYGAAALSRESAAYSVHALASAFVSEGSRATRSNAPVRSAQHALMRDGVAAW
ncbi:MULTISPECIES: hypothetical protein [Subtercola]|uniref:hypothetical protein n=1 Tax=Subtercola TaxID=120212 RepID=UPI0010A99F30|nr:MULTISPECIES: hypothetical protein [Subtercola]MEA9986490.1 hypothetical protein [Subtercola sp. RTI3]